MSVQYGSHLPMRAVIERSIIAQSGRMGDLDYENFGLNSHMGLYDEINFHDVFH